MPGLPGCRALKRPPNWPAPAARNADSGRKRYPEQDRQWGTLFCRQLLPRGVARFQMFLPAQYKVLSKQFVGRVIDEQFLAYLRAFVDPCGETRDTPHRREGARASSSWPTLWGAACLTKVRLLTRGPNGGPESKLLRGPDGPGAGSTRGPEVVGSTVETRCCLSGGG